MQIDAYSRLRLTSLETKSLRALGRCMPLLLPYDTGTEGMTSVWVFAGFGGRKEETLTSLLTLEQSVVPNVIPPKPLEGLLKGAISALCMRLVQQCTEVPTISYLGKATHAELVVNIPD